MVEKILLAGFILISMAVAILCFWRSKLKVARYIGIFAAAIPAVALVILIAINGGFSKSTMQVTAEERAADSSSFTTPAPTPTPTAQPGWSQWMVEADLPDGVVPGSEGVESRTEYASQTLEQVSANNTSTYLETDGWTQYDSIPGDWGSWSDWSATAAEKSNTRDVQVMMEYRYRDKESTTSTNSALSGWTQIGVKEEPTAWGEWSAWSDTPVAQSNTVDVQTQTYQPEKTQYAYVAYVGICRVRDCSAHGFGKRGYTYSSSHAKACFRDIVKDTKWNDTNDQKLKVFACDNGKRCNHIRTSTTRTVPAGDPVTQYRSRTRSITVTYKYTKTGSWSSWSSEEPSAAGNRELESRTLYRVCTRPITFCYQRWGELSDFSDTPVAANDTTKVETRVVYRYPLS